MIRKIMKKSGAVLLAAALAVSMMVPQTKVSAASQGTTKLKQQYFPQKKGKKNIARETAPSEWNPLEIKMYKFDNAEDALKYVLSGGVKYYNATYFKNPKKIKLTAEGTGTLFITILGDEDKPGILYDANQTVIKKIEDVYVKPQVQEGEVYYADFPAKCKEGAIAAYILKNECKSLRKDDLNLQKGTGKETYHTFKMNKRGNAQLTVTPLTEDGGKVSYKVQKNEKGKWITIGKTRAAKLDDVTTESYGLAAGNYRLVLKTSVKQVCSIGFTKDYYSKKKISYKKSKAKNLDAENIYTVNEKTARWYKVSVKSRKKQKKLWISTNLHDGGFKFTIYQKGKKKAIKTVKMKRNSWGKSVKLPKRVGTYYIKVSKLTKKTNGYYRISK